MRNTIFAPTHGYKRRGDQVTITDTVKNLSDPDTVILKEKLVGIMPGTSGKAPKNTVFKNYVNLKMIREGNANANKRATDYVIYREKTAKENGVGLGDTDNPTRNMKHLRGLDRLN